MHRPSWMKKGHKTSRSVSSLVNDSSHSLQHASEGSSVVITNASSSSLQRTLGQQSVNTTSVNSLNSVRSVPDQKYGLRVLHNPQSADIDIVFVHGLTGSRIRTWSEEGDGIFWPRDLLPKTVENARIMTFGYDADVVHFFTAASQNTVFDHGKALSGALANDRLRTETPSERPIIFVGHSLGGLVIEDCLLDSNISHELHIKQVLKSTIAIAFLGTPHCGSNMAEWASIGSKFLKLVTRPNKDIIGALAPESAVLARIQQDFHRMLAGLPSERKINITCFFEELPVQGVGKVVPEHSAILTAYTNYGLHANHMDMARFSGLEDPNYTRVANEIWRWARQSTKRGKVEVPVERTLEPTDISTVNHSLPTTKEGAKAARSASTPAVESLSKGKKNPRLRNLGCKVLKADEPGMEHEIDIVFVHGLMGHWIESWETEGVCWPRDLLHETITNARIITFGYDGNVVRFFGRTSEATINDHANKLCLSLGSLREKSNTTTRPIIFVGHGFGGLVIEDCFTHSHVSADEHIHDIYTSTLGFVFLGTPHGGSDDFITVGETCLEIDPIVTESAKPEILQLLKASSEVLARIQDNFRTRLRDIRSRQGKINVICYSEGLQMEELGKVVVPAHSARLEGELHDQLPVCHTDLAKFEDDEDPGYIAVTDEMNRWIRKWKESASIPASVGAIQGDGSAKSAEASAMVDRLRLLYDPNSACKNPAQEDMERIMNFRGARIEGTCEWILEREEYKLWLEDRNAHLLWLYGRPGKGKTFFAIFLTTKLLEVVKVNKGNMIAYHFCDNKHKSRNTVESIFYGLILQLLQQCPALFKKIKEYEDSDSADTSNPHGNRWEAIDSESSKNRAQNSLLNLVQLRKLFRDMINDPAIREIYCIVDGLDECLKSSEFLDEIARLFNGRPQKKVKFIITSRDHPSIREALASISTSISLDQATKEVGQDVDRFIDARVKAICASKDYADEESVKRNLKEKANETFLWVSLVCTELQQAHTGRAIESKLNSLPSGLDDIYLRVLNEVLIDCREDTKRILVWVTFAKRPLTSEELATVLSFPSSSAPPQSPDDARRAIRDIIRVCSSLMQELHGTVKLVHQSAMDFLFNEFSKPANSAAWFHISPGEAERVLTETCFNYVQKTAVDRIENCRNTKDTFLAYAIQFWPQHASESVETVGQLFNLENEFFKKVSPLRMAWTSQWDSLQQKWMGIDGYKPLQIACYFGIMPLVEKLVGSEGIKPNARDDPPLCIAVRQNRLAVARFLLQLRNPLGWRKVKIDSAELLDAAVVSEEMMKLVLEQKGIDIAATNKGGNTALHLAVERGSETVVKLLLDHGGIDIAGTNKGGDTALHLAAWRGSETMMKLLLDHGGTDIAATNKGGNTALHLAVDRGSEAVLKLLLDHGGIDIAATDKGGNTALHLAVERGSEAVLKLLLDHGGIDIAATNKGGNTALHLAIEKESETVVKLLLDHGGIDTAAADGDRKTALHWAARRGSETIVKLLLDHGGIDITATDKRGKTALHLAARSGSETMVKLLLDHGGIDISAADKYGETALHWAARSWSKAVVKLLLDHGGIDIAATDKYGKTALHWAVERGAKAVVKLLLDHGGIDIAAADERGKTALHLAAQRGLEMMVKLLLDHEGIDIAAADVDGKTALHLAARSGSETMVKLLLDHGRIDIAAADKYGDTALHWAARRGSETMVKLLLDHGGTDIAATNKDGNTALHLAARRGSETMVKLLLDHEGIDIAATDKDGNTALHLAVERGSETVVKLLLDHGRIDIAATNKYGKTALHLAARRASEAVVKLLLDHGGIDIAATDVDGKTALHYASASLGESEAVAEMLLDRRGINITARNKSRKTALDITTKEKYKKTAALIRNYVPPQGSNSNEPENKEQTAVGSWFSLINFYTRPKTPRG